MATLASSSLCSTSTSSKSTIPCLSSYSSLKLCHKKAKFGVATLIPQLGLGSFSQWDGLKHLGISITPKCITKEKRRRFKGMVVRASLFGVGAPEALVIGVVALLVFGPKGLAEVARNLGKTLRDFQPAIKELQEVSREFKSTLEKEIGLDEISSELRSTYNSNKGSAVPTASSTVKTENSPITPDPNGASSPNRAYSSEDYLKMTEDQLKASASQQQAQIAPLEGSQLEPQPQSQDGASSPNRAYSGEDYLKVTEEQPKASASQQQAQVAPLEETQLELQPQSQGTQEQAATTMPSAEKPENQA